MPSISRVFFAFLQQVLLTHKNISKAKGKTADELVLGRKVRLSIKIHFDLFEKTNFKPNKDTEAQPATFIIGRGINTSWFQPNQSERTVLVSKKQIPRFSQENNTTNETSDLVNDEIERKTFTNSRGSTQTSLR